MAMSLGAALAGALGGCGNDLPETIPVAGRVTFAGQECPAAGTVTFLPIEAADGYPLRPGTGEFDADGHYRATTYRAGDGLVPGTYRLRVLCWKERPVEGNAGVNYVPTGFEPPQVEVATSAGKLTVCPVKSA